MTDLKDEIAGQLQGSAFTYSTTGEGPGAEDEAQAIIDLIIARIPPLVWGQSYWLDGNRVTPAGFYEVCNESSGCYVYFAKEKILGFNVCWDEDDAKAAANAHHVAQLCKGMGIE